MNCQHTDCTNTVTARGLCMSHYHRARRAGTLTRTYATKLRTGYIAYRTAHERVLAALGPARLHLCRWCHARPAQHWAYTHTDPNVMFSPQGWPYSADPSHYIALCARHHKQLDRGMTEWERAQHEAA